VYVVLCACVCVCMYLRVVNVSQFNARGCVGPYDTMARHEWQVTDVVRCKVRKEVQICLKSCKDAVSLKKPITISTIKRAERCYPAVGTSL
jgi:hypothetical protein